MKNQMILKLMHTKYIIIIFALTISVSILVTMEYSLLQDTLLHNGKWIPTKSTLKVYGVMGAMEYYVQRQALAQCNLHLESWFGYQEVIYKNRINPRRIKFDFLLSDSAYFYFIFNKNAEKFSAVRFSLNKYLDNNYLVVSNIGEFLKSIKIAPPDIKKNTWNHFEAIFDKNGISIHLNDKFIGSYDENILNEYFIGFRGGQEKVLIDNIKAEDFNFNTIVNETFCYHKNFLLLSIITWTLVVLLNYVLLLILSADIIADNNIFKHLAFINLLMLVLSFFVYFIDFIFIMSRYPSCNTLLFNLEHNYTRFKDILEPQPEGAIKPAGKIKNNEFGALYLQYSHPEKKIYRILFVGASQIRGVGAFREEEIISKVVERKLNEQSNKNIKFECVNVAIDGRPLSYLMKDYDKWISLFPKMIIVAFSFSNISNSDLQRLCSMNKERQIKTVFFFGAESFEKGMFEEDRDESEKIRIDAILKSIANENNIPAFEYNSYLSARKADGIIWWDSMHLTPYGQQLVGVYIFNKIKYLSNLLEAK